MWIGDRLWWTHFNFSRPHNLLNVLQEFDSPLSTVRGNLASVADQVNMGQQPQNHWMHLARLLARQKIM